MKLILYFLAPLFFCSHSFSQSITFERYYDFGASEYGNCVQQTPDGGFVITGGYNNSATTGADLLIMKTDSAGTLLWEKTYGGPYVDAGTFVQNTFDGGFIVTGFKDDISTSNSKIWLLKMEANGDTIWTKIITAGLGANHANYVQQTTDSGYFIAGYTSASGAGAYDVFIVKTNSIGDTLWTRTFGGSGSDGAYSAEQTSDGGYIIAGGTGSFGAGLGDMYLIKTNSLGDSLWTKTYGGTRPDNCYSVQQTFDGGYILVGYSESFLDTIFSDIYWVKTNSMGDTLWTKDYYDYGGNVSYSVKQTNDTGFIISGSLSNPNHADIWLIKTNFLGDTLWTKQFGHYSTVEYGYSLCATSDGGYAVVGETNDFTNPENIYFIKTDSTGNVATGINNISGNESSVIIYPNPFSTCATIVIKQESGIINMELKVFDLFGQEVRSIKLLTQNTKIERENISSGIYFYKIIDDKKIFVQENSLFSSKYNFLKFNTMKG